MCCTLLLQYYSSIAIILMGKRELIALLNLSSWCLVMVERLFLTVPRGCLQFVIVVFPDHTHYFCCCWLLLSLWDSSIVLCFVVRYFVSILIFEIISMGKRMLVALLCLSSWCLVVVVWHFLMMPRVYLQFMIVVFPDHTHLVILCCKSLINTPSCVLGLYIYIPKHWLISKGH